MLCPSRDFEQGTSLSIFCITFVLMFILSFNLAAHFIGSLLMLVLLLAGIVFIFFIGAKRVLCFGYVTKTALVTHPHILLLLMRAYAASRLPVSQTGSPASRLGVQTSLAGDTAETADPNVTNGMSQTIRHCAQQQQLGKKGRSGGTQTFRVKPFVFQHNCYI